MKDYFGNQLRVEDIVVTNIVSVIPNVLISGKILEIKDDEDDNNLGIAKIQVLYKDTNKEDIIYRVGIQVIKPYQFAQIESLETQIKRLQNELNNLKNGQNLTIEQKFSNAYEDFMANNI